MSYQASSKGQSGEIQVALAICTLDRTIYHAIHNVTVAAEDGTTQIDHVVISGYGVFVVETKNYSGWIFGNERQSEWTRVKFGRKFPFQNPLRQNYRHIKVLSGFLGLGEEKFHSVVAFCGESEFKTPMPANVLCSGYGDYIRSKQEIHLADDEVFRYVEKLKGGMLPRGDATDRLHVESLGKRHGHSKHVQEAGESIRTKGHWKLRIRRRASKPRSDSIDSGQTRQDSYRRQDGAKERVTSIGTRLPLGSRNGSGVAMLFSVILSVFVISALASLFKSDHRHGHTQNVQQETSLYQTSSLPQAPRKQAPSRVVRPHPLVLDTIARPEVDANGAVPISAMEARQAAWQGWYKRSPSCEGANSDVVKCANHYIVAKREFERRYAAGQLK